MTALRKVQNISLIILAVLLLSISINMFLGPHQIAAGGVSGLGILAEAAFSIDRSIVVLVLNCLMLLLTIIFLGKKVFFNTLIGSLLFPFFLAVVPEIMVTSDRLLSVLFGSAIFGIGVAILYKIGASSGGTTIPPLILQKYWHINTSTGLLVTDALIVLLNVFIFGVESFLFAILSIIITSIVMTYIETGVKRRKSILIFSQNKTTEIKEELLHTVNRGITLFNVTGGKTQQENQMLMIVSSNSEYPAVMQTIDRIDPTSFVIVSNVAEVHGLGFTYHPIQ